jgi:hypothetical protein
MVKEKSKYEIQGEEFLKAHGIEFQPEYEGHGLYFKEDKEKRAIWSINFSRDGKRGLKGLNLRFGQSLVNSFKKSDRRGFGGGLDKSQPIRRAPTAYDVLACLTKYDPGTFDDFCGDMGMDTDSRKALDTYLAVQEEWNKVRAFFTREEIEELQDIN